MANEIIAQPAYGSAINAIAEAAGTTTEEIIRKLGTADIDIYNDGQIVRYAQEAWGIKLTPMFKQDIAGYAIVENVPIPVDEITTDIVKYNSNVAIDKYQVSYPVQTAKVTDVETGTDIIQYSQGATKVSTGQNILSVIGAVNAATAAASVGIALGKTIDSTLYNLNPDFWDANGMSSLNPETWSNITNNEAGLLGNIFDFVFGIDQTTQATQAYIDQEAFAYLARWLQSTGVFSKTINPVDVSINASITNSDIIIGRIGDLAILAYGTISGIDETILDGVGLLCLYQFTSTSTPIFDIWYFPNATDFNIISSAGPYVINSMLPAKTGNSNSRLYFKTTSSRGIRSSAGSWYGYGTSSRNYIQSFSPFTTNLTSEYKTSAVVGTIGEGSVSGINTDPNAIQPTNTNTWTDQQTTLTDLQNQYPDLWDEAVTLSNVQPDGSTITHTYVPVPWPEINPQSPTQPTSSTSTQIDPQIRPSTDPNPSPDTLTKTITQTITPPTDPTENPPDTGSGTTPVGPLPAGTSQALFAVYNPTQGEVNSFGAWLWSPNFVDQLLKLFNDPMQSIIGLHKVFATPIVSGTQNIYVGYLDSGVSSNIVGSQYTTVNCGTVNLSEYFNNVFDYAPFTEVSIYLPFIGIQKLDVADVMRSSITVNYEVDVLTGACLASISVIRDDSGGVIYQYAGNCAVQYPISSGSYISVIGAIAGAAIAPVAAVNMPFMAGAAVLGGAARGLANMRTNVERSGSFSGNAGAMGSKKPYLIISRPQTKLASTFPHQQGYPTNNGAVLGSYSGFVRCRAENLDGVTATSDELVEIETLLGTGVLV